MAKSWSSVLTSTFPDVYSVSEVMVTVNAASFDYVLEDSIL